VQVSIKIKESITIEIQTPYNLRLVIDCRGLIVPVVVVEDRIYYRDFVRGNNLSVFNQNA